MTNTFWLPEEAVKQIHEWCNCEIIHETVKNSRSNTTPVYCVTLFDKDKNRLYFLNVWEEHTGWRHSVSGKADIHIKDGKIEIEVK